MTDQLISFETAKLAKEVGFDVPVMSLYECRNRFNHPTKGTPKYDLVDYLQESGDVPDVFIRNWNKHKGKYSDISAPTQSLLQRWLREEHGIHIVIIPTVTSYWTFKSVTVLTAKDGLDFVSDTPPYKNVSGQDYGSYEQALEGGLQEALKLLIND